MCCIFPHLTDNQRIRFRRLDCCTESPQETIIQLIRNIQPPTVNIKLPNPVGTHITEVLAQIRICCIGFRHVGNIRETGILWIFVGFRDLWILWELIEARVVF